MPVEKLFDPCPGFNDAVVLSREFFQRPTLKVAHDILGKILARVIGRRVIAGRIVEVEAYRGNDPASHAYRGKTRRNSPMFDEGGTIYVYFTYGMHYCFNIVTEEAGSPAALLIRAVEPLCGIDIMKKNRKTTELYNLTNGPAKLCQALNIERGLSGRKLNDGKLYVLDDGFKVSRNLIQRSGRIGIKAGTDLLWRFYLKGNRFVSKVQPIK
ncbi:MAG: DNA-3-methyladenine glycosylase [Candidatus Kryptoniota bacterium]